jgi:hypothetical protein
MNLQDWYLEPVSPADNSEQLQGIYPEFTWSSSLFNTRFKIQISQTTGFGDAETLTYPSTSDEWMNDTSFFADDATTQELDTLLSASPIAYWRVITKDRYGIEKGSDIRSFIITPKFPVFSWESSEDYTRYKVQFSTVESFEEQYTLTFGSDGAGLDEPTITLERLETAKLIVLNHALQDLYWRVLAQDGYGNEVISEARRIVVSLTR